MKDPRRALSIFTIALVVALAFFIAPGVEDSGQRASAESPYTLIYYDGHMHTKRSDGNGTVAQIKATALSRGLGAVIITDHCNMLTLQEWQSLVAQTAAASEPGTFLALPAFEITGSEGMLNRGHMNAYNVPDPFVGDDALELCPEEVWEDPPNPAGTGANAESLAKWAEYVHSQGGIANHNHTSGSTQLGYGVDNIEIYNQGHVDAVFSFAKLLGYSDEEARGFAIMLNDLAIYGERDVNTPVRWPTGEWIPMRLAIYYATAMATHVGQWLGSPEAPLNSWDDLLMAYVDGTVDRPIFAVANSDAHNTGQPDSQVGVAKNGLYVAALTPEGVYEAIKAGRSFATTGPSLTFDVNGKLMGSTVHIPGGGSANLNLSANSQSPTAMLVKIDIIKNGDVWQTVSPMSPAYDGTFDDSVTEDGYYRVEVTSQDLVTGAYQFAYSNPVFMSTAPIADLKVVSQYVESPPTEILLSQDVQITLDKVIHNNGPAEPVDAMTTTTITVPADCTATPNPHTQEFHDLPVSLDILHHEPFTVHCYKLGTYTFTFDDTVEVTSAGVVDPEPSNDTIQTKLTLNSVARADVKITSAGFVSPPTKIPLGQNVDVTLRKHIHNNGPRTPVDIAITSTPTPPTGCTITPKNVPASISGVPVSVDQTVDEVWTVKCTQAALKTFVFNVSIDVSTPYVSDPNRANNAVRRLLTVRDPSYPYWADDICDGLDNDGDTVVDEDWNLVGSAAADCLDPALNTDSDGLTNDVDTDDDGDGWSDAQEGFMRTDPLSACPIDRFHDAWPPDINNDQKVNIADVILFRSPLNGAYDRRYDLKADGKVSIADVILYRSVLGRSCTP